MKNYLLFVIAFLLILCVTPYAQAATVTVSQSGADSGTVMQGKAFIITVSDLSDSGTVTLTDTPAGFSSSEGTLKSFSSGTTSVSWTTTTISQAQTGVKIKAIISGTGSPTTAESSSFNVVLPPSVSLSVTPSTASVTAGSAYTVNLNVQNSGGTTAKSVALSVSPSSMTKSSGCSTISSISAGSSSSVSCTVLASTAGTITATFTATPSNADAASDTVSVTVASTGGTPPGGPGTGPSGAVGPVTSKKNTANKQFKLVPGVGLRDNAKLQEAIEKVLAKGKLSDQAKENLLRLSASIASDTEITKYMESSKTKSNITLKIKYKGDRKVMKFMLYEKLPKAFASSSDNITVSVSGATYDIVQKDPEYLFTFPELSSGETTITFNVNKEVNTTALDQTATEVYGEVYEGLEEGKICALGEKKCFDNDLKQCATDGKSWTTLKTCEYGCEDGACKPPPAGAPQEIDWQSLLTIGLPALAVIIVLIVIVVAVKKRSGKKKFSPPKPMPQMKERPENLPS